MWRRGGGRRGLRGCCGGSFEVLVKERRVLVGLKAQMFVHVLRAASAELRSLKVIGRSVKTCNDGRSTARYTD